MTHVVTSRVTVLKVATKKKEDEARFAGLAPSVNLLCGWAISPSPHPSRVAADSRFATGVESSVSSSVDLFVLTSIHSSSTPSFVFHHPKHLGYRHVVSDFRSNIFGAR